MRVVIPATPLISSKKRGKMKTIIILFAFLVSSPAFAQRSVKNGAGLTEQDIIYLTTHFQSLTSAFTQDFGTSQAREVELITRKINSIQLLFKHETSASSEPFAVHEKTWWVHTAHLENYDLNSNQELEWSEASDLLLDMYFAGSES
ncbi:MAG: hypothetical protein AB7O96_06220 [Pseudobdellovibrionaceae bacterium]